jgi:polar amino acid transport system substrate-binding protein
MTSRCRWISFILAALFASTVSAQTKPLRIGAEDDWAPFSSGVNGKPEGMAVDMVRAIFAEAGIAIELLALPYARCMDEAKSGQIAGCFDTLPDAQLRQDYLFHAKPLFSDPIIILTRQNNPAKTMSAAGLSGQTVIITNGYTYGDAFEANKSVRRMVAGKDINTLRMLEAGRGEYALVYSRIARRLLRGPAQDMADKVKSLGTLEDANLYISFSRQAPGIAEIVARFDAAHERLVKSGALAVIGRRWD